MTNFRSSFELSRKFQTRAFPIRTMDDPNPEMHDYSSSQCREKVHVFILFFNVFLSIAAMHLKKDYAKAPTTFVSYMVVSFHRNDYFLVKAAQLCELRRYKQNFKVS